MKRILTTIYLLLTIQIAMATHNRAGEITYKRTGNLTYEITITTYTYAPSYADRCELELQWGDGTSSTLPRSNGGSGINPNGIQCDHLGVIVGPDIKMNKYIATHTYPSPGTYIISLNDPNRNLGIVNIPNSVNTPFYIETVLVVNPFLGNDNSPVLLNPPIDNACVGEPFIHNPGAYDADGDSLSYKIIKCKGADGKDIPGYTYPQTSKTFSINSVTGDLLWDSPVLQGEYNVAILIMEWRYGVLIGSIIRDMQINVAACDNHPPVIKTIDDTCIVAGTKLNFKVTATDPDGDGVTLSGNGGPFVVHDSAVFKTTFHVATVSSDFNWQTTCNHIRKYPWSVIFRAVDDGKPINLVALKAVNITIVAPPLENLTATPLGNTIVLKWNKSNCGNVEGYKIYRSNDCRHLVPNNCETGLPLNSGYIYIGQTNSVNDTTFTDSNNGKGLKHGVIYSYVVTSYMSDGSESLVSSEACTSLIKDVPVITNVSITATDNTNGSAYVAWSKPTELDTNKIHGPFRYLILRSQGINNTNFIKIDSLNSLNDTIYTDLHLNTSDVQFNYRIDLYSVNPLKRFKIGSTEPASSVFLSIQPTDNKLILSWQLDVPWNNSKYIIYRKLPNASQFDSLTWTGSTTFTDTALINDTTYCYYIKSTGKYSEPGILNPIINLSQEVCAKPIDNVSPCPPYLIVETDCDSINTLKWTIPDNSCAADIKEYKIWYSPTDQKDFVLIDTIPETTYTHINISGIAGCYAITAIDKNKNQSAYSNIVCLDIDICSQYRLPDIFTPNGDNHNNVFEPFKPIQNVRSIDMKIYNRWGLLVFKTTDPAIKWDGREINSGKMCSDGVYFYVCIVYEQRLKGLTSRVLQGNVTIIH